MRKQKINPRIDFDFDEMMTYVKRLRKAKPKTKVTDEMMKHPHQVIRWWAINGKNIKRYEHLYYKDKSYFVRQKIVNKTKNVEILSYATSHDKNGKIRREAGIRLSHLMQNGDEKRN